MNPNSSENPDKTLQPNNPSGSERRSAGWDIKNSFRNYSTLVAAQFAMAFFSFASVWLATRYLGTEGYGAIVAIIAAAQVAQIFVNWTCVSLARFGIQEFVETGNINRSFWARTLILLPNTLLILLFSFLWLPLLSSWLKLPPEAAWYVVAYFLVLAVWFHVQYALHGAKLPHLNGILLALERCLTFLTLLSLVWFGKLTYLTAISAYIISPLLLSLIGLVELRKFVSWRIEIDAVLFKKILRFSIPLIPFSLVGYLTTNYLDAIFITQYLSKADLGIYSVAYQINGILMQFPTLAGTLLLPLFVTLHTGKNIERVTAYMEEILPLLTLIGGLVGIASAFVSNFLIPLVFGQELNQAVIIFWILVSSTVFAIPGILGYTPFTNSISATYIATFMAVVAAAVNLMANFILIPRYGLKGSAWATVLAYGASFLVPMIIIRRRFSIRPNWLVPAIVPSLAATAYVSWTGDTSTGLLLGFAIAFVIVVMYRRSIKTGIQLLMSYRNITA